MSDFSPNVACAVSPMVRRVVASNAGPMTGPGTNTYLVGVDDITVIDPGPEEPAHLDAIIASAPNGISRILLTHFHADHAPGARGLRAATGAPVYASVMSDDVPVDHVLWNNDMVPSREYEMRALFTPGHAAQHLCFLLGPEQAIFTGDTVLDGMTTVITPDGGDMNAYLSSLDRLIALQPARIYPGHGDVIDTATERVRQYVQHRRDREAQILALVSRDAVLTSTIVEKVYPDLDPALVEAAAWQVHAHLVALRSDGRVVGDTTRGWSLAN